MAFLFMSEDNHNHIEQKNTNEKQLILNLPEFNDRSYSVKSDVLANAVLGYQIKTTYKRAFEGLLSKISTVDINAYIKEDKPLIVSLSPREYQQRFPRERNITKTFSETARYYQKNSSLEILYPNDAGNIGKEEYINVVDTARIKENGDIEILFTRGILPHLNDVRGRLLIMNIDEFGKLTGKYSQKIFEIFSAWLSKDVTINKVEIEWLRMILKVPESYNFSRFKKQILDISIKDIHEHTQVKVNYEAEKEGRSFKYINFIISNKQQGEMDLISEDLDLITNQFKEKGITDEMFFALKSRRESLGLASDQVGMNAACNILIKIAKMKDTLDLESVFDTTIVSKWKSYKAIYYKIEQENRQNTHNIKPSKKRDHQEQQEDKGNFNFNQRPEEANYDLSNYSSQESESLFEIKKQLKEKLSQQEYDTWIEPLKAFENKNEVLIICPSGFVFDWVNKKYIDSIKNTARSLNPNLSVILKYSL